MSDASSRDDQCAGVHRLLDVIRRLRAENGCPWDRAQTLQTLKPYLIEESYELLEAIDSGDVDHHKEELGDVLLQVLLQCQIRSENKDFTFDQVADRLAEKLIRRHPHVFGDVKVSGEKEVLQNWEQIKATEKNARKSILDGVPKQLPSLQKAQRIQSRAARVGFDWAETKSVLDKIDEELAETRHALESGNPDHIKEELGDLLFAVVNLSRRQGIHAEEALAEATSKFSRRFKEVERRFLSAGRKLADCTLSELDAEWDRVKADEKLQGPRSE